MTLLVAPSTSAVRVPDGADPWTLTPLTVVQFPVHPNSPFGPVAPVPADPPFNPEPAVYDSKPSYAISAARPRDGATMSSPATIKAPMDFLTSPPVQKQQIHRL